jgi:hypothetical protein
MRTFGFVLLVAGVAGFFYCGSRASEFEPLRAGLSVEESVQTDRGQWDTGRYVCAAAAFMGFALTIITKNR